VVTARYFCDLLKESGLEFYTGVPCSILDNVIKCLSADSEVGYIPAVKENIAMGLATGSALTGRLPVVLMQNSGLGNTINALTSLNLLYRIPVLMVITWRGHEGQDAPEHLIMGRVMLAFLREMDIPTTILAETGMSEVIKSSVRLMKEKQTPVALILKKGIIQ